MKTKLLSILLTLALVCCLLPAAAFAEDAPAETLISPAPQLPFYTVAVGREFDNAIILEDGYTPFVYDAAAGDMVPGTPVITYIVELPYGAKTATLHFNQNVLAYNYMEDGTYLDGWYSDDLFMVGAETATVKVDSNEDGKPDYIQVQSPYDEYWNTEILYAVTFEYEMMPFTAYVGEDELTEVSLLEDSYVPYIYDAAVNDMVPGTPVYTYAVTVPLDTEKVWLVFPESYLAYNYAPGNVYLDGLYGDEELYVGQDNAVVKVDANGDFQPDFIQVQSPYDPDTWATTNLFAVTFRYELPFEDVAPDAWYAGAVAWALKSNFTNGTSETTFSPLKTCNFAEILTFLYRLVGSPEVNGELPAGMEDVWYADPLRWAVGTGIISAEQFDPKAPVTRADIVTFMWKAAGSPEAVAELAFEDVPEDAAYTTAVQWAVQEGITKGTSDTTFSPDKALNRATIITLLSRSVKG